MLGEANAILKLDSACTKSSQFNLPQHCSLLHAHAVQSHFHLQQEPPCSRKLPFNLQMLPCGHHGACIACRLGCLRGSALHNRSKRVPDDLDQCFCCAGTCGLVASALGFTPLNTSCVVSPGCEMFVYKCRFAAPFVASMQWPTCKEAQALKKTQPCYENVIATAALRRSSSDADQWLEPSVSKQVWRMVKISWAKQGGNRPSC